MAEYKDNELISKILASNNIVDVIGEYINLEHKGKNFFGVCPFHDDHSPSMSVSPEKNIFKCFSCGASGNAITFLMDYLGIEFKEALKMLADNAGIILDSSFTKKKVNSEYEELYKINSLVVSLFKNNLASTKGKEAREYLKKRGLDEETIKYFDIGLAIDNLISNTISKKYSKNILKDIDLCNEYNNKLYDTFDNRIMFPISDKDGNVIGFTGRVYRNVDSDEHKYVNTKETVIFKKGNILYNLNNAKEFIRKEKSIIICEGQMDTIRLHTIGVNNVVSLSGTSITKEQMDLISSMKCDIILNLDQDEAGKKGNITLGDAFTSLGKNVSVIVFNDAKDTDELVLKKGENAFLSAYRNRVDYITFKLDYLKANKNLNDSVELSKYINAAIESLNRINDDILIELKLKEISEKYGISISTLKSKIKKKESVKATPIKKENTKKYKGYQKTELRLLYLMLNNEDVLLSYENNLGFLVTKEFTDFANEILSFKYKNHGFSLSDFMTYVYQNSLDGLLKEIMENGGPEDYTDEELEYLMNIVKESTVEKEIEKLKIRQKESLDEEEKKSITKKIENMRKEVLTWYKK
jgi:DNA primase